MVMHAHSYCDQVFIVDGAYPEITYVDIDTVITREIRDVIINKRIALIRGASKSGKTLLVTHIMRYMNNKRIWLQGALITSQTSIWESISYDLMKNFDISHLTTDPHQIAIKLAEHDFTLIIDDFHHIYNTAVRQQICSYLKALNEYGISIIIIGVESPQIRDILKSDLRARIISIILEGWNPDQLKLIGSKGFNRGGHSLLNLELLADESFTSPFLMQLLCKTYCEHIGTEKLMSSIERINPKFVQIILPIVANHISYMEVYSILTHSSDNKDLYKRHDGKIGNINQMILYAISSNYPIGTWTKLDVHVGRLWHRLHEILHPSEHSKIDTPQNGIELIDYSVNSMINAYESYYNKELTKDNIRHDPVVDLVGQLFCIRDPFLLFYLRNSSEVESQFES